MSRTEGESAVARQLAEVSGTCAEDWFPVFKARYGMEVVFRATGEHHGNGNVVSQSFTCATAIDPILTAGLVPRYADISSSTFALDPTQLTITDADRVVVIQHTFGIVSDEASREIKAKAQRQNGDVVIVEDSAHAVTRMALSPEGKPLADVSVHSFGAEKLLPTKFGGAIWVNPDMADKELRARIVKSLSDLSTPSGRVDWATRAYRNQLRVLTRLPRPAQRVGRGLLERLGLFEPPVAQAELRGTLVHPPLRPSRWIISQMEQGLRDIDEHIAGRCAITEIYRTGLAGAVDYPGAIRSDLQPLVRFPVVLSSAEAAQRLTAELRAQKVYVGSWYRPGLFPGVEDPSVYHWDEDSPELATTRSLTERVVNLPTRATEAEARRIVGLVKSWLSAVS